MIISFILVISAIMVVAGRHILHSAFYLAATLLCVAMYFILLRAEYLAAVQILVYIGSIVVLILFALMMTRTKVGHRTNISNNQRIFAALVALALFVCLTLVFYNAKIDTVADNVSNLKIISIKEFANILFSGYTLPFEVASVLLLAALVGSVVLAMKEKTDEESSGDDPEKESAGIANVDAEKKESK
ncbi:MAG: NADH-quinone oxidoreductase subunit J [Actinobacteria bacterium]|nr:NADH-quinone oxidoreductase subunit J [Actinomycetota bacterium]